ncbi:MAG: hypothetical protein NC078_11620 [Ruminococcus sp.]|nr:hypothetical protein [Ruminococcus sp.]
MNIKKSLPVFATLLLLTACGDTSSPEIPAAGGVTVTVSESKLQKEYETAEETVTESKTVTGEQDASVTELPVGVMTADEEESQAAPSESSEEDVPEGDLSDDNVPDDEDTAFTEDYDWEAQNEALDKYSKMLESFPAYDGETEYPDDYCGAYYSDGCLYVALTDISEENLKRYKEILGSGSVLYVQHKYPIKRLSALNDYVVELMHASDREIYGVGISETNNHVGITVGSEKAMESLTAEIIAMGFEEDTFSMEIGTMGVLC